MLKVAINGTGRIGLCVARILGARDDIEIAAINTTMDIDMLVHLIKYDSVHSHDIFVQKESDKEILIGKSKHIAISRERDISKISFGEASLVFECTGVF